VSFREELDAVVTHHRDGYRSGVARFNELLARELGVPILGLDELASARYPLLSFKVREMSPDDIALVERSIADVERWQVYLHEFADLPLERDLVLGAERVLCGNLEIAAAVDRMNDAVEAVWSPGLIQDARPFPQAEVSVFSFGMAHKIQTDKFQELGRLLDESGLTYALYVSAANHETASLRDAEVVFDEMHALFPERLYFLGNLSDVAVVNYLRASTFYAAFFPDGVRGNNSSVASAMHYGSVVITNLDEFSPREFRHLENVIDINQCTSLPTDPSMLRTIGDAAQETSRSRDWSAFVQRLRLAPDRA
jgi:hypothetical protein